MKEIKKFKPILNKTKRTLKLRLNKDEIYSIYLYTLWTCSKTFDRSKGSFTNYLKKSLRNNLLSESYQNYSLNFLPEQEYEYLSFEEIIDGLSASDKELLRDKYIYNYTFKEIAKMSKRPRQWISQRHDYLIGKLRRTYVDGK